MGGVRDEFQKGKRPSLPVFHISDSNCAHISTYENKEKLKIKEKRISKWHQDDTPWYPVIVVVCIMTVAKICRCCMRLQFLSG